MDKHEEETRDRGVEVAEAALAWRKAITYWEDMDLDAAFASQENLTEWDLAYQEVAATEPTLIAALDAYAAAKRRAESMRGIDGGG